MWDFPENHALWWGVDLEVEMPGTVGLFELLEPLELLGPVGLPQMVGLFEQVEQSEGSPWCIHIES